MRTLLLSLSAAALALAQKSVDFEGRPGTLIENDKVALTILTRGGAFVSLTLKDDPQKNDPMWNPVRLSRETGGPQRFGDSLGHFVCVDGFGPTSKEEQAAGLMGHGEAHRQTWERVSATKDGATFKIKFRTTLPLVHEGFTRQVEVVDGEQVVYVESELENLLAFDRPINWAEHGTIGAPFLSPVKTVVDASVGRCQTRPHDGRPPHTLDGGKEFTYPVAPLAAGSTRNIRSVPNPPNSMDHTGCVLDPSLRLVFVSALNTEKKLLFGYLFRREEYPWLQEWMNYPASGALSRGLEFGTQPFDVPRRQTVDTGKLFDVPAFRWLPAKSKIGSRFLMFYTQVPDGFQGVTSVKQENGQLVIVDGKSGKQVTLKASLAL